MQKFRFRLESVLRLRTIRLAAEKDKLGRALAEVNRLEKAVDALVAERGAALEFVKNEPGTGSTELRALSAYLIGYEARLFKLQGAVDAAKAKAAEQRQRVAAADREERLLLKLKEKQHAEWQAAADRELEVLAQESWNSVHFDRNS